MIVATAGHVDHGKTTLVRALTGVDTDHAPESAARGMTIDLGFAAGWLDAQTRAAFIDVPGHERFIRNMLAGVGAVDLALLVVAADDGPMPQTREHLAILQLLGTPRLVVALSKCDRVDAARQRQAAAEVAAMLADSAFAQAPVLAAAAATGDGVAALRARLAAEAAALQRAPATGGFRLAIDRSFTVDGSGRVVTGAVLAGSLAVGDVVQLAPAGVPLRVRGLQVLNQPAGVVQAGQRCAVNLAGAELKRADPRRGDWLTAPDAPPPTDRLDVQLHWLPGVAPAPGPRAQWLLHLGAATRTVRWVPLSDPVAGAAPGSTGFARLLLDQPVVAAWGDRFILRDAAANRTLAGGRVVDAFGPLRGRAQPQRLASLRALAVEDAAASLQALLDASPAGVDLAHFAANRGWPDDAAAALAPTTGLRRLPGGLGLSNPRWHAWRARLLQVIDQWHADQPDSLGPDADRLGALLDSADGAPALLRPGLAALVDEGSLQRDGLVWRRPGHRPVLPAADAGLLDRVLALIAPAGLRPPIVGDLAQQLALPLPELLDGLGRLVARGLLVRVAPNRFYTPAGAAQLEAEARALAADRGGLIDAAAYRDRTGIGRNLAVQVLEFLDRSGATRFDGKHHHLRDETGPRLRATVPPTEEGPGSRWSPRSSTPW